MDVATPRRGRNPSTYSARGKLLAQGIRHVPSRVLPRLRRRGTPSSGPPRSRTTSRVLLDVQLVKLRQLNLRFATPARGGDPTWPAPLPCPGRTKLRYHVCGTRVRPHPAPFFCDEVRTVASELWRRSALPSAQQAAVHGCGTRAADYPRCAAQTAPRSCSSPAVAGQRRAGALWPGSCATRYRARLALATKT